MQEVVSRNWIENDIFRANIKHAAIMMEISVVEVLKAGRVKLGEDIVLWCFKTQFQDLDFCNSNLVAPPPYNPQTIEQFRILRVLQTVFAV